MPSSKPAIAVRLPPHVFEVFARLAELQGRSRGSVVAELLEAVYPPLMRSVALMEAAIEAPAQVRDGLRQTLEDLELDLVKTAGGSLAQMDMLIERTRERGHGEAERREAPHPRAPSVAPKSGRKGGLTPVAVTRGSGLVKRTASRTRKPRSGGA